MTTVLPHTGRYAPSFPRPFRSSVPVHGDNLIGLEPLIETLDRHSEDRALAMFRDELRDTKEIAWLMECTEAAAANGIANARERARARL